MNHGESFTYTRRNRGQWDAETAQAVARRRLIPCPVADQPVLPGLEGPQLTLSLGLGTHEASEPARLPLGEPEAATGSFISSGTNQKDNSERKVSRNVGSSGQLHRQARAGQSTDNQLYRPF